MASGRSPCNFRGSRTSGSTFVSRSWRRCCAEGDVVPVLIVSPQRRADLSYRGKPARRQRRPDPSARDDHGRAFARGRHYRVDVSSSGGSYCTRREGRIPGRSIGTRPAARYDFRLIGCIRIRSSSPRRNCRRPAHRPIKVRILVGARVPALAVAGRCRRLTVSSARPNRRALVRSRRERHPPPPGATRCRGRPYRRPPSRGHVPSSLPPRPGAARAASTRTRGIREASACRRRRLTASGLCRRTHRDEHSRSRAKSRIADVRYAVAATSPGACLRPLLLARLVIGASPRAEQEGNAQAIPNS